MSEKSYEGQVAGPEMFNYGPFCSLVIPEETPTGAIADLDGDGLMDLTLLFLYRGFKHDDLGRFVSVKYSIELMKVNLEYDFLLYPQVYMDGKVGKQGTTHVNETDVPMRQVKFLPYEKQPWTSYLGKRGNGVYNP
ncbi:uncharacterized protein LOC135498857 [Lineus longissimus]|uniref:uncharacterized protein LOC135498857 n=1 Tax=Lineus longissimus TaxID=88925 RepID=UPI00315D554F